MSLSVRKYLMAALFVAALVAIVATTPPGLAQLRSYTVDDVLDRPEEFIGKEMTLEGEVDHVYNSKAFAMEDDQDLFGEDEILVISAMGDLQVGGEPESKLMRDTKFTIVASGTQQAGRLNGYDENQVNGAVNNQVNRKSGKSRDQVNGELGILSERQHEGKTVQATGMIRWFNRSELERDFGTLDWSGVPEEKFAGKPVLIVGGREMMARPQPEPQITPEEPAVEPTPEPEARPDGEVEPEPEPEVEPPAEPEVEEPTPEVEEEPAELPPTATGMPLMALIGLLSLAFGIGLRLFR